MTAKITSITDSKIITEIEGIEAHLNADGNGWICCYFDDCEDQPTQKAAISAINGMLDYAEAV